MNMYITKGVFKFHHDNVFELLSCDLFVWFNCAFFVFVNGGDKQ